MTKATVTLFYDTRSSKDKVGLLKLYVYFERKQRLYTTGEKISPEEWDFLERTKGGLPGTVKSEERRMLWQRVYGQYRNGSGRQQDGYLVRAKAIVDQLGDTFSFEGFAEALANYGKQQEKPAEQTDLLAALLAKAISMTNAGRIGNAVNYELAAKSLRRFVDSLTDEERKDFF